MRQSVAAGHIVDAPSEDTLSDATAGVLFLRVWLAMGWAGGVAVSSPLQTVTQPFTALRCCVILSPSNSQNTGGIEQGAITLQPCVDYVDTWLTVAEAEIADAMVSLLHHHSKLVEGAAGCAVAAVRKLAGQGVLLTGRKVVVVCCGGNVAVPVLQRVLASGKVW